ncbi:MAG: hypothetical protein JSR44_11225 [Spirochaetes bacterium]|nr:hypothetical protein [Spirochaetota bacterium]
MKWQNLKSKAIEYFGAPHRKINALIRYLRTPLNLFRFIILLFALDFIAFMSLTKNSYLQLLNPLAVLFVPHGERLTAMELYFPRSLSLTGLEKMYLEDADTDAKPTPGNNRALPATEGKNIEKPLGENDIAAEVIAVKKHVVKSAGRIGNRVLNPTESTARRVILELLAGPEGEIESLKARNLLKEPLFLRSIWSNDGTLYISTEKAAWDKMSPNEQKITSYCISESLRKNLGGVKFALLKE